MFTTGRCSLVEERDAKPGGRAVICLHDDTPLGKDEPAGLGGRDSMHYADELARRGFVCLVPDYPSYGEDHYDLKANADQFASGAMKAVWDNIRGIDLLETRNERGGHMLNFLEAVRDPSKPVNCPFELGFRISIACRMAVDSYRQQRTVRWDTVKEEIV